MPRPQNSFTELAGVPVHYDRFPEAEFSYGTRGKPLTFHCTEEFERKLTDSFQELWDVCPLGRAEVITSAGAYVEKPGAHGKGRGFDVDGIFWTNKTFVTLHYPQDRRFYLGVEAVLRKHFGTVLNYEYNVSHQDHLHIDDLTATGFVPGHRSRVLFVQMALSFLFNRSVAIDGAIGPETEAAARDLLIELNLCDPADISTSSGLHEQMDAVWPSLLDRAAEAGFSDTPPAGAPARDPLKLIEDLYAVIERELGGGPARKRVETALTTFVNHEETDAWLKQFREHE